MSCKVSRNPKSNRCWKFQLSILTNKKKFYSNIWSVPCTPWIIFFFSQQMPYCLATPLVYMALVFLHHRILTSIIFDSPCSSKIKTRLKVSWTRALNKFMRTPIFQNSNENIVRMSALKFYSFLGAFVKLFGASCRLPYLWYYLLSLQEATKISGQKSLQYFSCYFGKSMSS